jgi:hypothetical protein
MILSTIHEKWFRTEEDIIEDEKSLMHMIEASYEHIIP